MRPTILLLLLLLLLLIAPMRSFALSVQAGVSYQPTCNYPSGTVQAYASGGVGPYSFLWSTGATTEEVNGLPPGTYSVTVTDYMGTQATAEVTLTGQPYALRDIKEMFTNVLCGDSTVVYVFGGAVYDGQDLYMGYPPYYLNGVQMQLSPDLSWEGVPYYTWTGIPAQYGAEVSYTFQDGGCSGTLTESVGYPVEWPSVSILDIQGAHSELNDGSITLQTGMEGHGQTIRFKIETLGHSSVAEWNIGSAVFTFTQPLASGDYLLTRFISNSGNDIVIPGFQCDPVSIPFTIPDLGGGYGNLQGTFFMDNNNDCAKQYNEPGVPGMVVEILPGPTYTMTTNGTYSVNLPFGSYTLEQQSAILDAHCQPGPIPFTVDQGSIHQTLNVADTALVPMDARVMVGSTAARPGFSMRCAAKVTNLTLASTGPSTLTFNLDTLFPIISADPPPSFSVGHTLTWQIPAISSFQETQVDVYIQVPPDINLLGTQLHFDAQFTTGNVDADPANNTASGATTVTGSYDPNDKVAQTSSGASKEFYYIDADQWIDYTIRFQNTGSDTAFNVVVTDTIPADLDLATFIDGASSHPYSLSIRGGNVLRWAFYNIQLPDSNVNGPASQGFVSFRIRPRQPLAAGTVIANTANIYFDFNDPVITEPSVLTAEFSTGVQAQAPRKNLWLMPNPTSGLLEVRVPEGNATNGLLQVVSVDGRVVLQQRMEGPRTLLDVAQLSRGLYTLTWHDVNGSVTTQRFVRE